MLKVDRHNWRVTFIGIRLHGFHFGAFFIGAGLALCFHDYPDLRALLRR